jgi:hypothetical protein
MHLSMEIGDSGIGIGDLNDYHTISSDLLGGHHAIN